MTTPACSAQRRVRDQQQTSSTTSSPRKTSIDGTRPTVGAVVAIYALAAWTLFTWGTRISNAVQDAEPLTGFVVPLVLLGLAVASIARPLRWGRLLAVAASLAWLVRVPVILLGDHGTGFVVVHTALAAITWGLAWWTLQVTARRPAPA